MQVAPRGLLVGRSCCCAGRLVRFVFRLARLGLFLLSLLVACGERRAAQGDERATRDNAVPRRTVRADADGRSRLEDKARAQRAASRTRLDGFLCSFICFVVSFHPPSRPVRVAVSPRNAEGTAVVSPRSVETRRACSSLTACLTWCDFFLLFSFFAFLALCDTLSSISGSSL